MSNNKEKREYRDIVHLYLALQRPSKQGSWHKRCIRSVIKHDDDLAVFEAKIRAIGGEFRIYKTVNARSVEKAYKWFMKCMIDYPERASCVDSIWRTALLQRECKVTKYFMLDIDTKDKKKLEEIKLMIPESTDITNLSIDWKYAKNSQLMNHPIKKIPCELEYICRRETILEKIESPKGWHYITLPFDTREICKLDYVTLLRDGYHYVKTVGEK